MIINSELFLGLTFFGSDFEDLFFPKLRKLKQKQFLLTCKQNQKRHEKLHYGKG